MIKEKFNANRKTDRQTDRRIDGQKEQRDKKKHATELWENKKTVLSKPAIKLHF